MSVATVARLIKCQLSTTTKARRPQSSLICLCVAVHGLVTLFLPCCCMVLWDSARYVLSPINDQPNHPAVRSPVTLPKVWPHESCLRALVGCFSHTQGTQPHLTANCWSCSCPHDHTLSFPFRSTKKAYWNSTAQSVFQPGVILVSRQVPSSPFASGNVFSLTVVHGNDDIAGDRAVETFQKVAGPNVLAALNRCLCSRLGSHGMRSNTTSRGEGGGGSCLVGEGARGASGSGGSPPHILPPLRQVDVVTAKVYDDWGEDSYFDYACVVVKCASA